MLFFVSQLPLARQRSVFLLSQVVVCKHRVFGVEIQMTKISIPHATEVYIDRETEVPRAILMIATHLPEHSADVPFAQSRQEMLEAIVSIVGMEGLDGYEIKWGSTVESTLED